MNTGLAIFKRLQRGITDLPGMQIDPSPKEAAGLYDPGELSDEEYNQAYEENEMLHDLVAAGLTQDELDFARAHPPEEWPQSLRDKLLDTTGAEESDRASYAKGTSDVLHLAGGSGRVVYYGPGAGDPNSAATRIGAWGDRLGPNSVAVSPADIASGKYTPGQWINTPRGWKQVQDTSWVKPGRPNPSGTMEYWLPRGGRPGGGGGGGGNIPGGPFEGWDPGDVSSWHSGAGPGQMGYPSFSGNTAGPGGTPLTYNTTSYNVPGYGWVPQAQLANAQASGNLWDYMNPFGGTSRGGAGTGDPTQRAVGTAVGTASNLIIPGIGFVTGPIARWITSLIQKNPGMNVQQVRQAVAEKQKEEFVAAAPGNPVKAASTGGGFNPFGNQAMGREWWSTDFGRGPGGGASAPGGYDLAGPGGGFGTRGIGFGQSFSGGGGFAGHTVGNLATAIGFGGPGFGGGGGGSNLGGRRAAGLLRPYTQEQYNRMGGPEKYASPALGTPTQRPSYQQYLQMWNPAGGGQGMAQKQPAMYGHTPKLAQFREGEEDVMDLHRGNFPVSEDELKDLPEWLAKMLRNIPLKPPGGNEREQFRPRSVPVMQGPRGKFYDPSYSREDERIMAALGTSDVNPGLKYFHQKQLRKKKP